MDVRSVLLVLLIWCEFSEFRRVFFTWKLYKVLRFSAIFYYIGTVHYTFSHAAFTFMKKIQLDRPCHSFVQKAIRWPPTDRIGTEKEAKDDKDDHEVGELDNNCYD